MDLEPAEAAENFNSHTHVEYDNPATLPKICVQISTHTLTWSTTLNNISTHTLTWISTHTLTWSTTCRIGYRLLFPFISTHTLTWSTTREPTCMQQLEQHFNSHTHVEYDLHESCEIGEKKRFQLTHSRGVRPGNGGAGTETGKFQLTHSRGVRLLFGMDHCDPAKFQLTHSRGVRLDSIAPEPISPKFQLTHSRGVRRVLNWIKRIRL